MTDGFTHRIERIAARPGHRLLVTWHDGEEVSVDFSANIRAGGIWSELRSQDVFARVRIAEGGRAIEWPEPSGLHGEPRIDVDADGLYDLAMNQKFSPIGKDLFEACRGRKGAIRQPPPRSDTSSAR